MSKHARSSSGATDRRHRASHRRRAGPSRSATRRPASGCGTSPTRGSPTSHAAVAAARRAFDETTGAPTRTCARCRRTPPGGPRRPRRTSSRSCSRPRPGCRCRSAPPTSTTRSPGCAASPAASTTRAARGHRRHHARHLAARGRGGGGRPGADRGRHRRAQARPGGGQRRPRARPHRPRRPSARGAQRGVDARRRRRHRAHPRRPGRRGAPFTGSAVAGERVQDAAGRAGKRVRLDVGGPRPCVPATTATSRRWSPRPPVSVAGQRRAGLSPAHERRGARRTGTPRRCGAAVEAMEGVVVGDPAEPDTLCGPLRSVVARDRVRRYLDLADRRAVTSRSAGTGSTGPAGGSRRPSSVDSPPVRALVREEVLGPVLTVAVAG